MTWPAVTRAMRDYLAANSGVSALVGSRVRFKVRPSDHYPLITVQRVGGGQDAGIAPFDRPLLAVDIWGAKGDGQGTEAVASAVRSALDLIQSGTSLNADVMAFGASVIGAQELSDPVDGRPRVALTVDVTARAVPA